MIRAKKGAARQEGMGTTKIYFHLGIHAIFGGFVMGVVSPREHGWAIYITERIEDIVVILLLPLYFVVSGLATNLRNLTDGVTFVWLFKFFLIYNFLILYFFFIWFTFNFHFLLLSSPLPPPFFFYIDL